MVKNPKSKNKEEHVGRKDLNVQDSPPPPPFCMSYGRFDNNYLKEDKIGRQFEKWPKSVNLVDWEKDQNYTTLILGSF